VKYDTRTPLTDKEVHQEYARAYHDKIAIVIPFNEMEKFGLHEYELIVKIGVKLYGN
jgi:hypothetical protein